MADLKPCPFCGGEANIVTYQGSKRIFYIECKGCNALMGNPRIMISGMKGKLYFENEAELIEAWNTRKPMEAVVAELNETGRKFCENVGCSKECENCEHGALMRTIISIVRGRR